MKKQIKEIEKAMKNYKEKEEIANKAEEKFDNDPFNKEIEEEFDKAYEEEHKALTTAAELIARITGIETKTARIMIMKNGEEIINIVSRVA